MNMKCKILVFGFLTLFIIIMKNVKAQSVNTTEHQKLLSKEYQLFLQKSDSKYGVFDNKNSNILPCKYDTIYLKNNFIYAISTQENSRDIEIFYMNGSILDWHRILKRPKSNDQNLEVDVVNPFFIFYTYYGGISTMDTLFYKGKKISIGNHLILSSDRILISAPKIDLNKKNQYYLLNASFDTLKTVTTTNIFTTFKNYCVEYKYPITSKEVNIYDQDMNLLIQNVELMNDNLNVITQTILPNKNNDIFHFEENYDWSSQPASYFLKYHNFIIRARDYQKNPPIFLEDSIQSCLYSYEIYSSDGKRLDMEPSIYDSRSTVRCEGDAFRYNPILKNIYAKIDSINMQLERD